MLGKRLKTVAAALGLTFLLVGSSAGAYLATLQLTGNFHTVIAGEVYRSAQPSNADIARAQRVYGIKTILNLRGGDQSQAAHDAEIATSKSLGLVHIDFPLSDTVEVTPAQMHQLIAIMRDAPKPLLIHCKAGADRSGLASALYLAAIAQKGEKAAEDQLSLKYGHISLSLSPSFAMDESWEQMEPVLGYHES